MTRRPSPTEAKRDRDPTPRLGDDVPRPVAPPIYQTSTFWSPDADDFLRMATQDRHPAFYTRYGNPTVRELENAVAHLEGGEAAMATASGMSAIVAAILTFAGSGAHLVAQRQLYGGAMGFLKNIAPKLGISVDFFDPTDPESFAVALRPETSLVMLESPTNPLMQLADIDALAAHAHSASQAIVLVDNTVATPLNQQPLSLGADLVMHSLTKSIGGHSDITGGLLAGSEELINEIWRTSFVLGATLDPFAAWLAYRGLRTLDLRVARHNATALVIAEALEDHPRVTAVHHPWLASHPQAALARRQMNGGGGVLSFEVEGGLAAAERVLQGLRRAQRSASFGSVTTLVVHPAAMWASMLNENQMRDASIPAGLIRLGVGLEPAAEILADLEEAIANG